MSPYNFPASGSILTKLFPGNVPRGRGDKMGITFGRPVPWNLGGRKNVKILARFLTTFDFDREYLRNASTYCNGKSILSTRTHSTLGEKNTWTLVHNQKSYSGSYWPTQADILRETSFRPLGVLSPHIFTRVADWPTLASAHHKWDGGTSKKFNRENLKFGLKFSVWAPITSGLVAVSSENFFWATCHQAGVIKWYKFWKAHLLKFWKA